MATAVERERLARVDKTAERELRGPVLRKAQAHVEEARRQLQAAEGRVADDRPLPVDASNRARIAQQTALAELTGTAVTAAAWTALPREARAAAVSEYMLVPRGIRLAHRPELAGTAEDTGAGKTAEPVTLARMAALPAWGQIELCEEAYDVMEIEEDLKQILFYIDDASKNRAPDVWSRAYEAGLVKVNAGLDEDQMLRAVASALPGRRGGARGGGAGQLLVSGGGWNSDVHGGRLLLEAVTGLRRMLAHPSLPPPDIDFPQPGDGAGGSRKRKDEPDEFDLASDGSAEGGVRALIKRAKRRLATCVAERTKAEAEWEKTGKATGCPELSFLNATMKQEDAARRHLQNLGSQACLLVALSALSLSHALNSTAFRVEG